MKGSRRAPYIAPNSAAELPEMTLVDCTLVGWSGCQKWERSAYPAIIDTRLDTRSDPVRAGALLFPEDDSLAVSYRLPGGAPDLAISAGELFSVPIGPRRSGLVMVGGGQCRGPSRSAPPRLGSERERRTTTARAMGGSSEARRAPGRARGVSPPRLRS